MTDTQTETPVTETDIPNAPDAPNETPNATPDGENVNPDEVTEPEMSLEDALKILSEVKHPSVIGYWDIMIEALGVINANRETLAKATVDNTQIGLWLKNTEDEAIKAKITEMEELRKRAYELETELTKTARTAIAPELSPEDKKRLTDEFNDSKETVDTFVNAMRRFVIPKLPVLWEKNKKLMESIPSVEAAVEVLDSKKPTLRGIGGGTSRIATAGTTAPKKNPDTPEIRKWAQAQGLNVAERGRIDDAIQQLYYEAHPDKVRPTA